MTPYLNGINLNSAENIAEAITAIVTYTPFNLDLSFSNSSMRLSKLSISALTSFSIKFTSFAKSFCILSIFAESFVFDFISSKISLSSTTFSLLL